MNGWMFFAGVVALVCAVFHGGIPELTIFRRIRATPLPDPGMPKLLQFLAGRTPAESTASVWNSLRAGWHLATIDALVTGIAFLYLSTSGAAGGPLALTTAVRFAGYTVLWFVAVSLRHRTPLHAPQWILTATVALASWRAA